MEMFLALIQVRMSFPRSAVVGSGKKGELAPDSEEELLDAVMAREREEEDEFLQTVQQDETLKEQQAEVYFSKESGDA